MESVTTPAYLLAQADALRIPLADRSVDLVFGSPPYCSQRTYGRKDIARKDAEWVAWMLLVTAEALRVSKGAVVWVVAGYTKDRNYRAVCEALAADWQRYGVGSGLYLDGIELPRLRPGECHLYRPVYWYRHGISGSGGDQWFRADTEYVMCFKRPGKIPWANPKAVGHAPKWPVGGAMSYRTEDGRRINAAKMIRGWDGKKAPKKFNQPDIANPGNLVRTNAGKGHMGHDLAHDNEAPFPEALAEFFVKSLCPPGGICLDPFSGSGTTASVAARNGRIGLGFDLRGSQCDLGRRRIEDQLQQAERPHKPRTTKRRKQSVTHAFLPGLRP